MKSALAKIAVKTLLGCIIPILILLAWHAYTRTGSIDGVNPIVGQGEVLPKPEAVLDVLLHPFRETEGFYCKPIGDCVTISVLRMLCGFILAAISGIVVGIALGASKTFSAMFAPITSAAMAISPLAWIPLAIIFIGAGTPAEWIAGEQNAHNYPLLDSLKFAVILIIWAGAFFPIALSTAQGIRNVRWSHLEIAKSLGADRFQIIKMVIFPSSLPSIFTGLRLGAGVAWRVILAAEMFPGTTGGLGFLIQTAQNESAFSYAFAGVVMIAGIGILFDGIMRLLQWKITSWCKEQTY